MSGLETISISATPERLRSTRVNSGMLVVDRLAGVLLQVQALDADLQRGAVDIDLHLALADNRLLELRDLIALRQIGIEVVLAVEDRHQIDLRLQSEPRAHGLGDALLVDHRQHAGHGRVHQGHVAVGRAAECRRGARKQLRLGGDLGMHLEADDHLPVAGGAPHEIVGSILRHELRTLHRRSLSSCPCTRATGAPGSRRTCRATRCGTSAPACSICAKLKRKIGICSPILA